MTGSAAIGCAAYCIFVRHKLVVGLGYLTCSLVTSVVQAISRSRDKLSQPVGHRDLRLGLSLSKIDRWLGY